MDICKYFNLGVSSISGKDSDEVQRNTKKGQLPDGSPLVNKKYRVT